MKIADKRDDGDTTIYMTLTSTSTLGGKSASKIEPEDRIQIVSWVAQTLKQLSLHQLQYQNMSPFQILILH